MISTLKFKFVLPLIQLNCSFSITDLLVKQLKISDNEKNQFMHIKTKLKNRFFTKEKAKTKTKTKTKTAKK
jgi:hypothetical protein